MNCPNCGALIPDDNLLCTACGYEIQIVPDFEAEINLQIEDTIADISAGIVRAEENKKKNEIKRKKQTQTERMTLFYKLFAAGLVVVLFGVFIAIALLRDKPEDLSQKAQEALAEGDVDKAIEQALKAYNNEPDNLNFAIQLAKCYANADRKVDAKSMYRTVLEKDPANLDAYDGMIEIYKQDGEFDSINELIMSSGKEEIMNQYTMYLAQAPAFSIAQGEYEEELKLRLTSNTTGTIYYSLDNSTPGVNSEVYNGYIELGEGLWTVNAIFINDFGIKSEVSTCIYDIKLPTINEINVYPESGSFTTPQMISVDSDSDISVYYTSDGSEPTVNSTLYKTPIVMPFGDSTYKFISVGSNGNTGEVVTKKYNFQLNSGLDQNFATGLLINKLVQKGVILDIKGTSPKQDGVNRYVCNTAINVGGKNYYLFVEYYQDILNNTSRTGSLYCIDADSGELYRATTDNNGGYSVQPY